MAAEKKNKALATELGKVPPQAVEVEEAVLGSMMLEQDAVEYVLGELTPESFYNPRNRMVFEAIRSLSNDNIAVDLLTVVERMKALGTLEKAGGHVHLADITTNSLSCMHLEYHVSILKQKAIQRGLISASYDIQNMAYDDSVNVDDLMIQSQAKVCDIIDKNVRSQTCNVKDMIHSVIEDIEDLQKGGKPIGVYTGFRELENVSMGWQKGNLIIIGARPGVGKTAIALNLAANAAVRGRTPVAFFSLEMTSVEIIKRLIEAETGITGDKIKGGSKLTKEDWAQLESKISGLASCDFFIDDTPAITTTEFKAKAKTLVTTKGVGIIFIDYLQLMKHPGAPNIREEVSEVSHMLKATAKDLKVPIIALAQLNRLVDQRGGGMGRPILSDIKESGAIEQDADIVMFLHRPDQMGLSEDPSLKNYAEIIVAKNRNGAVGSIPLEYREDIVKFVEPEFLSN